MIISWQPQWSICDLCAPELNSFVIFWLSSEIASLSRLACRQAAPEAGCSYS